MKIRNLILQIWFLIGIAFVLGACNKESDEPKNPSSEVEQPNEGDISTADFELFYAIPSIETSFQALEMSAHEHKNVSIAEIHSNVANFTLSSTTPAGYEISFKKNEKKDSHGFYVYNVYADMPMVEEFGPTELNSLENQYNNLIINLILTGKGYKDGVPTQIENMILVPVRRYKICNIQLDNIINYSLAKEWVLTEYKANSFQNIMEWNETQHKYTIKQNEKTHYIFSDTPIKVTRLFKDYTIQGEEFYSEMMMRCELKMFGWPYRENFKCSGWLNNGKIIINNNSSNNNNIYMLYVVDKMVCSSDEYDKNGNLAVQHIYTFEIK